MNNVFLQLKNNFVFRQEPLKKLVQKQADKALYETIQKFFGQKHNQTIQYANLVKDLLLLAKNKQTIEKLLHLLVYFSTLLETGKFIQILESIKRSNSTPYMLVKFYSFIFKSVHNSTLKQWLINNTIDQMQNEPRTSPFTSFVENFNFIVQSLNLPNNKTIQLYFKLIEYLEKHSIYKQLASSYVFIALSLVNKQTQKSPTITKLFVRAIYSDQFSDNSIDILNKEEIKSHDLYQVLQARMTGDIQSLEKVSIWKKYEKELNETTVVRKVKIQAIPRLFKHIKQASYQQASQMLKIDKAQVQDYIINAIKLGIIRAKLDEYQETIIVNKINLRCLKKNQQIQLQKQISDLCQKLDSIQ